MKESMIAVAIKNDREAEHVCSLVDQVGASYTRVDPDGLLACSLQLRSELVALVARIEDWSLTPMFFRKLEQSLPHLKVIVLSTKPWRPELKQAMRRNIFSCLLTPYEDDLEFCLRSILKAVKNA